MNLTILSAQLSAAALYSGVLILMGIVLQARVIMQRRTKLVGIGDGQDKELARAIRVHGNFSENAPVAIGALILLALVAAPAALMHLLGIMIVVGRAAHAFGLSRTAGSSPGRVAGMVLTLTALGIAALTLLARALW